MCNRICLSTDIAEIASRLNAGDRAQLRWRPHWNLSPGQVLPVIRYSPLLRTRRLDLMRWGLIPLWAKNTKIVCSNLDIHADAAPAGLLDPAHGVSHRCLVPVDNFYEWRARDRQPFAVALANRQFMTLAGIWDRWTSPTGEQVECFAILTTDPNPLLAPLCKRMPAIISPEAWDLWLGREPADAAAILELLRPCADAQLTAWPIARRVSNLKNDDPRILEAAEI